MATAFAKLAFTPGVQRAQTRYGSRAANARLEADTDAGYRLGETEAAYIATRDHFYLATVGETGWPYVQHRGGPAGFLRVLDATTLGYADFRGNRQYLSVGNLAGNDRVALILPDLAQRRRLKLWGRARVVEADDDPELIARLATPGYRARIERAWLIQLAAGDWNCPQHLTPRYTQAEIDARIQPLLDELARLCAILNPGEHDDETV